MALALEVHAPHVLGGGIVVLVATGLGVASLIDVVTTISGG